MVVMRGINDGEICEMAAYALGSGCELRFLELMPIGLAAPQFGRRFVASEAVREALSRDYVFTPLPGGEGTTSREYRVEDRDGRVGRIGFISPCTTPFCSACRRLRLTSDGHLVGCLARQDDRVNIRPLLGAPASWLAGGGDAIVDRVLGRRSSRRFDRCAPMAAVGG
jgi:cyclic pyranopterin phosphate synthase